MRSFARHETFHPRYGWFRKAYSVAAQDPYVFNRSAHSFSSRRTRPSS